VTDHVAHQVNPLPGTLYSGDNLDVLRHHMPDGLVDLVYLGPPDDSIANYIVVFAELEGTRAITQIRTIGELLDGRDGHAAAPAGGRHPRSAAVEAPGETGDPAAGDVNEQGSNVNMITQFEERLQKHACRR
jgi:hypothetical protein